MKETDIIILWANHRTSPVYHNNLSVPFFYGRHSFPEWIRLQTKFR